MSEKGIHGKRKEQKVEVTVNNQTGTVLAIITGIVLLQLQRYFVASVASSGSKE